MCLLIVRRAPVMWNSQNGQAPLGLSKNLLGLALYFQGFGNGPSCADKCLMKSLESPKIF